MPQILYSFTFNTETKEAVKAGNIDSRTALQILQDIVIAEAIGVATPQSKEDKSKDETTDS